MNKETISEWSETYSGERGQAVGDLCITHDGDAFRNAVVTKINHEKQTYDVEIIGLGTKVSNIPWSIWRPIEKDEPVKH